jgi:rhamnose transport system ATP-binding protein
VTTSSTVAAGPGGTGHVPVPPVVALDGVVKAFAGVRVLHGVSFDVRPGEVHALLGENGAGKSTLLKVLFGVHAPDGGRVVTGEGHEIHSPRDAVQAGFAIISQELSLVPDLTVAQNILLGQEPTQGPRIVWRSVRQQARATLELLGEPAIDPGAAVRDLTVAQQQLVEIARALRRSPRLVVMDEPTSSLSGQEVENLLAVVRRLRDAGTSVVYVSHRLGEVLAVADRATILRDGAVVTSFERPLPPEEALVRAMVGRELQDELRAERRHRIGEPVLEVEGVAREGVVAPASLTVHAGEIVGIAGLVGAGRTELARLIFGADRRDAGTVRVGGRELRSGRPSDAVAAGLAFLTEDRKGQGLVGELSVASNVTLPVLKTMQRAGALLDHGRRRRRAAELGEQLHLRPNRPGMPARSFSGGNQQKIVLAKWLATGARAFIVDEPTRGIDVGAKAEIYRLLEDLAAGGAAILVISSELTEVLRLSDRILVMREGEIVLDAPADQLDAEAIGRAMLGASSAVNHPEEEERHEEGRPR